MNQVSSTMTAFICANCASGGAPPAAGLRPASPDFDWPGSVRQVLVPCTGRLQPENVLRAFESGSSIVSIVACLEDNCQYIEGSRRCASRVDYIRSILKEIGLGEERLLLFRVAGSAPGVPVSAARPGAALHPADIREQAMQALRIQPPSPLAQSIHAGIEDSPDE